jgi:hypothetical protein
MKVVFYNLFAGCLDVADCKSLKNVEKVMAERGCDAVYCQGKFIEFVFIDKKGKAIQDCVDFEE